MNFPFQIHLSPIELLKTWLKKIRLIEMQTESDPISQIQNKGTNNHKRSEKNENDKR